MRSCQASTPATPPFGRVDKLASYAYLGAQDVVGTEYPEADVFRRQYGSSGLYPDLDRFGALEKDIGWDETRGLEAP